MDTEQVICIVDLALSALSESVEADKIVRIFSEYRSEMIGFLTEEEQSEQITEDEKVLLDALRKEQASLDSFYRSIKRNS